VTACRRLPPARTGAIRALARPSASAPPDSHRDTPARRPRTPHASPVGLGCQPRTRYTPTNRKARANRETTGTSPDAIPTHLPLGCKRRTAPGMLFGVD
jgi:hypothetical protein